MKKGYKQGLLNVLLIQYVLINAYNVLKFSQLKNWLCLFIESPLNV